MFNFRPRTCLLLTCLLLAACAGNNVSLQDGFNKYSALQFAEAQTIAEDYIRDNPNAADLDQAYYLRGISRMTLGNRIGAVSDLRTAITKTTRADLRSKAYRALGDIAFDQQQWADAIKNYELGLDNLNLAPTAVTYFNYRIGAALQCQGEWTKATPWFTKVVDAHNDAALTDRTIRRMYARNFAIQYGAFQEQAGAQSLQTQLRAANISAGIVPETRADSKIWYLVQSGSYPNWTEASVARSRVPTKFPAVIVP
jgi:tetratricopeptide (TPR) repeat protein